jgi:hypothetical protein
MNYIQILNQIISFIKSHMSLHVEPIIISGIPQEKEVVPEELGRQHTSSTTDSNLSFEQGKLQCM